MTAVPTDYTLCTGGPQPSSVSFSCPSGQTCIWLAGNSTVLCCPEGANCDRIQPITCIISQLDASKSPGNLVKSIALDVALPSCGEDTCCPFGFECDADQKCGKMADQSQLPQGHALVASSSLSTITSSLALTSPASTPSDESTTTPVAQPAGTVDKPVLISAIVASVVGLVIMVGVGVWLWKRRIAMGQQPARKSQARFEKAELDAGQEVARPQVTHEFPGLRSPVELPASPLSSRYLVSRIEECETDRGGTRNALNIHDNSWPLGRRSK